MNQPGRKFTQGSSYRYGFNGKENDNDVKGEGNQQDYEMRPYDVRLGRLISVDPLTGEYPYLTPFQFAENNPIENIDFLGMQGAVRTGYTAPTLPTLSNTLVSPGGGLSSNTRMSSSNLATLPAGSGNIPYTYNAPSKVTISYNGITQEKIEQMIPRYAITARIGSDGTGYCLQGEDQWGPYSFPLYTTNVPKPRTWMDNVNEAASIQIAKNFGMSSWNSYSVQPDPKISVTKTPPSISPTNDEQNNKELPKIYLVRRGADPETPEKLASDAEKAEKVPKFGHGVSTTMKNRISGTDKKDRSALLTDVAKIFKVKRTPTDNNPNHVTVIIPKPVTKEVAEKFNLLFKTKH